MQVVLLVTILRTGRAWKGNIALHQCVQNTRVLGGTPLHEPKPKASVNEGGPTLFSMRNMHGLLHFCTGANNSLRVTMQDQESGSAGQTLGLAAALDGATPGAADAHASVEAQAEGDARWASGDLPARPETFSLPGSLRGTSSACMRWWECACGRFAACWQLLGRCCGFCAVSL